MKVFLPISRTLYLLFTYFVAGLPGDILELSVAHRKEVSAVLEVSTEESSEGELAAMVSFAIAFPDGFMALVDTYDVKRYFAFRHSSLGSLFPTRLEYR